jgi:hypothetical protein
MMARPLCTRHDRPGTDDPELSAILDNAEGRAGRELDGLLKVLYDHDGQLLATWRDEAGRASFGPALTAAWHEAMGSDAGILNLVPTDEGYDYQEDVMDNPIDDYDRS